jgi:hypothetical protein
VVALPHSIAAFSTIKALISFSEGSRYTFWFSLLKVINYVSVLILLCTVLIKKTTPLELLIASIITLTNFSISTGGYILIIYIILIPYLFESAEYKKLIIYIVLIYALPVDWINFMQLDYESKTSYLSSNSFPSEESYFLAIGSIIRPLLNFSLLIVFLISLFRKYLRITSKY